MKKTFVVAAIAALGMISATVSFADALNGAAGKKLAAAVENKEKAKMHVVDVVVINHSDNNILVQNPPYLNHFVESGAVDRLPSDNYGNVRVQIVNTYNNSIVFNQEVCNRAIVTARGRYNSMSIYLDNSDCFKK